MVDRCTPPDDSCQWERDYASRPAVVVSFAQEETLSQKMIKAHYKLEQSEQSRYKSGYTKTHTKNTWDRARAAEVAGLRATKGDD